METTYQIVKKGIPSNKIYIDEYTDYLLYRKKIMEIRQNPLYILITTNIYFVR